jgi:hypothetical protein
MTWAQYRATVGRDNDINTFYAAKPPWQTFSGKCSVKPQSIWFERGPTSEGAEISNHQQHASVRKCSIDVRVPAFAGYTTLPDSKRFVQNAYAMRTLILSLGLPQSMLSGWTGLGRVKSEVESYTFSVNTYGRTKRWMMVTTTFQVIRVVEVFEVYNWNIEGNQGTANSWVDRGDAWKSVYSSSGYIEGRGIRDKPEERLESKPSNLRSRSVGESGGIVCRVIRCEEARESEHNGGSLKYIKYIAVHSSHCSIALISTDPSAATNHNSFWAANGRRNEIISHWFLPIGSIHLLLVASHKRVANR